ncbi:1-acylglycerol-3-phosphate O-acyltransferase [Psychrobium sp. 1_MG-2023]|uniref:1-acylglycerol-3-phosphate O-acyltransferase n=1 Tax=Psychrobium sp. 1_MG-2023 TaxID=3062624 RepID=UPI000C345A10|nr:1-acylglycerol-3-phosphate O-acyltransferase [Psychrobium sp. 1_MG-2023]MDP2561207.1 1-acylglycerol-3-phosphate O-acyltransferase [Psychrobium sp. 1_MG-2023]PKF55288.1 1-acyl-sn-glycerol-3-phosphate acyltransferase [Alteromonadales bacterium alter-6D02]
MVALFRILFFLPIVVVVCLIGILICVVRPFHRNNTYTVSKLLSSMAPLFGIKLLVRVPQDLTNTPKVIIGNHQNNFDLVTISGGVTPGVVSIGKKSLKWVPIFGQLYWLSGNILIDRKNKSRAAGTINQTADKMDKKNLSIWMFPEGTRSRGRGLLPFKTGAFHTAIQAQVPIIPIVLSSTGHFSLNRWNNGYAIVEHLPEIDTSSIDKSGIRDLAEQARQAMSDKIEQLDAEVAQLNAKK